MSKLEKAQEVFNAFKANPGCRVLRSEARMHLYDLQKSAEAAGDASAVSEAESMLDEIRSAMPSKKTFPARKPRAAKATARSNTPRPSTPVTPNDKLLAAIFGEAP